MISLFTRAFRQACSPTLLPREGGIGNDRYMKGLYVVDVYGGISRSVNRKLATAATNLVTGQTLHPIPKLALEKVHDQTVVPALVCLPFLLARNLQREPFEFCLSLRCRLNLRLVQNPIQVLV